MTIPTLTSSMFLFHVHRDRVAMMTYREKRKAALFVCGIVTCLSIVAYTLIIHFKW